jgi:hypothetical protein
VEKTALEALERRVSMFQQEYDSAYARHCLRRVDLWEETRGLLESLKADGGASEASPVTRRAIDALRERANGFKTAAEAKALALATLGQGEPANDNARVIAAIRGAEIRRSLAHLDSKGLEAAWERADGETRRALVEGPLRPALGGDGVVVFEPWIPSAFVERQAQRAARLAHPGQAFEIAALEALARSLLAIANAAARGHRRYDAGEPRTAVAAAVEEALLA